MDSESINDLLALVSGNLSPTERERILAQLASDKEARDLVLLGYSHSPAPGSVANYPFEVLPGIRVGSQQDYFRVIQLAHFRLGKQERRAEKALSKVALRRLPLCFKERIELQMQRESSNGGIRLTLLWKEGEVVVRMRGDGSGKDHLEVWSQGNLVRAISASLADEIPAKAFAPEEPLVLRFSHQDRGLALQWVPLEFGLSDWFAGCLTTALAGNLRESVRLLRTEILERFPDPGLISRLVCLLESVGAVTKNTQGILAPVPLTRSATSTLEDRKSALSVVWRGIGACWPEANQGPNPWDEEAEQSTPKPRLPEGVAELVEALFKAVEQEPDRSGWPTEETSDRDLSEGWTALRGWTYLLNGNLEAAKKSFESVKFSRKDPFSLGEAVCLADHLLTHQIGFRAEEEKLSSSLAVWRRVFEKVLE